MIDGGWKTCGIGSEIISSVVESIRPCFLKNAPINISLKQCPAPTSSILEEEYYPSVKEIICCIKSKIFL